MSSGNDKAGEDAGDLPATALPKERPGRPGGRRDVNRRERVRALSEAAVRLFLDQGIEGTTIDDITKAAGVSKGSFYRYFEDKEELVAWVFAAPRKEVGEAFDACAEDLETADTHQAQMDAYQDLGARLTRTMLSHSEVALLYLQEARAPGVGARRPVRALADEMAARAVDLTKLASGRGLLRPFPPSVSALAVVGAAERLTFALLTGEDIGDPLMVPGALASLILDGIVAPELPRPAPASPDGTGP